MKERMIVNCSCEEFFDALVLTLKEQYYAAKGKRLPKEKLQKGFTFDVRSGTKARQILGKVKILEYVENEIYRMEYKSETFHRISGATIREIENGKTEVILENLEEKIKDGQVVKTNTSNQENTIRNVGLKTRFQINRMIKEAKKHR